MFWYLFLSSLLSCWIRQVMVQKKCERNLGLLQAIPSFEHTPGPGYNFNVDCQCLFKSSTPDFLVNFYPFYDFNYTQQIWWNFQATGRSQSRYRPFHLLNLHLWPGYNLNIDCQYLFKTLCLIWWIYFLFLIALLSCINFSYFWTAFKYGWFILVIMFIFSLSIFIFIKHTY